MRIICKVRHDSKSFLIGSTRPGSSCSEFGQGAKDGSLSHAHVVQLQAIISSNAERRSPKARERISSPIGDHLGVQTPNSTLTLCLLLSIRPLPTFAEKRRQIGAETGLSIRAVAMKAYSHYGEVDCMSLVLSQ